jgi:predicted RNA-binding Zn-ribbon protein involved in translation (DUF1610 family)
MRREWQVSNFKKSIIMKSALKCPKCGSTEVSPFIGAKEGQYDCLECGYNGPIGERKVRKIKTI